MSDEYNFQWFNAYITARKYTAKMLREKILQKTGHDIEQQFLEEIIEIMGQTAYEFMRLQQQVFTINVVKEDNLNDTTRNEGEDDDDEPTQH
jgi:ADP-glucose pyrophosphorylase